MISGNKMLNNIFGWIVRDYREHPVRCVVEILGWSMSVAANIMFMWTVPAVPFVWFLSLTVASSAIFAWALWTRNSLGGLANYAFLVAVDTVALIKLLFF
jgi:hypothetical protein